MPYKVTDNVFTMKITDVNRFIDPSLINSYSSLQDMLSRLYGSKYDCNIVYNVLEINIDATHLDINVKEMLTNIVDMILINNGNVIVNYNTLYTANFPYILDPITKLYNIPQSDLIGVIQIIGRERKYEAPPLTIDENDGVNTFFIYCANYVPPVP